MYKSFLGLTIANRRSMYSNMTWNTSSNVLGAACIIQCKRQWALKTSAKHVPGKSKSKKNRMNSVKFLIKSEKRLQQTGLGIHTLSSGWKQGWMMPFISRYRLSYSSPFGLGWVVSIGTFTPSITCCSSSMTSTTIRGYLSANQR